MREVNVAKKTGITYKDAGVDIEAGDEVVRRIRRLVESTHGPRVLPLYGGFGGLFRLDYDRELFKRNFVEPVLVSSADSVGTKVRLAFMTGVHDTVGIDLVNHCGNDIVVLGAEPLFFLDYIGTGRLSPDVAEALVAGLAEGCRETGCSLLGGETAELPGLYQPDEYDLVGFIVGVVERGKIVSGADVEPGDLVVGLAANGLHTNGYTLARKLVFEIGGLKVGDRVDELGATVGEAMLAPHRSYVRAVRRVLAHYRVKHVVKAMAHITGGGIPGNLARVLPPGTAARIKRGSWPEPPIFGFLQRLGDVADEEMFRVFNMGVGMTAVVSPYYADSVLNQFRRLGHEAYLIGRITRGRGEVVVK